MLAYALKSSHNPKVVGSNPTPAAMVNAELAVPGFKESASFII